MASFLWCLLFAIRGNAELMHWFGTGPLTDIAAARGLIKAFAGWCQQENPGMSLGLPEQRAAAAARHMRIVSLGLQLAQMRTRL